MGVLVLLTFGGGGGGGVVQNRESPDFRSPEVGRYGNVQKSMMHIQSYCFAYLNLLFFAILIAVTIIIA